MVWVVRVENSVREVRVRGGWCGCFWELEFGRCGDGEMGVGSMMVVRLDENGERLCGTRRPIGSVELLPCQEKRGFFYVQCYFFFSVSGS